MRLFRRSGLPFLRVFLVAALSLSCIPPVFSQTTNQLPHAWSEAVYALAQKAAAAMGPARPFSTDVKDVSGAAPVELAEVERTFDQDMQARGMRPVAAPGDTQVQISISQDVGGFVLVAEIRRADAQQVAIVAVGAEESQPEQPAPSPGLTRKIVWQQSTPLLDFDQLTGDAGRVSWYLLEPDKLSVYEFDGGQEVLHEVSTISGRFATRDLRGWIQASDATHVTTFVGGARCDATWSPTFTLECRENNEQQWPAGAGSWTFVPGRNYFSGTVTLSSSLETKFPPFFSSASPTAQSSTQGPSRRVVAGIDGEAQFFEGGAGAVANFDGWGSDIVSVAGACGSEWQAMATGTGDWTEKDRIQLYEIRDRKAIAIGQPLELPGPTLALWPMDDGKAARVVSRNLETGLYEASIVSVSCGN